MKLILASSSPRRAELLRGAGIAFEVCAPQVEEVRQPNEPVEKMVARFAEAKARAAAESVGENNRAIIVGADTAVELDSAIFGKPRDTVDAREMLSYLSGRTHYVLTGIFALRLPDGATRSAVERTAVTFAPLDPNEIEAYVTSGEPFDKAGGYAIQGRAGRYIPRIEGCYFNVVGLPLARLHVLVGELGWRDNVQA
jgi:nucleoside triphosphate pyrophosphatase